MYKVIVKYLKSGRTYDIKFKSYESAFDYAKQLKLSLGDYVIVRIETKAIKIHENEFTAHIMTRFTRRN